MTNNSLPPDSNAIIAPSATVTTCRLLELPGELRNRIYRLVLVKDDDSGITYSSAGLSRPGLLNTCKRVRSEALPIFYCENAWETNITNYDASVAERMNRCWIQLGLNPSEKREKNRIHHTIPSWPNLLEWLRAYHSQAPFATCLFPSDVVAGSTHFSPAQKRRPEYLIRLALGGLFVTVKALRGQPWELVHETISEQRALLAA